jgi:hypothetical protein
MASRAAYMPRSLGLVSDTHGLLRPEALEALRGVERILHAGDVGAPHVIAALQTIAPVVAVRSNNGRGAWARTLRRRVAGGFVVFRLRSSRCDLR